MFKQVIRDASFRAIMGLNTARPDRVLRTDVRLNLACPSLV
jgi:hypothetical protein